MGSGQRPFNSTSLLLLLLQSISSVQYATTARHRNHPYVDLPEGSDPWSRLYLPGRISNACRSKSWGHFFVFLSLPIIKVLVLPYLRVILRIRLFCALHTLDKQRIEDSDPRPEEIETFGQISAAILLGSYRPHDQGVACLPDPHQ